MKRFAMVMMVLAGLLLLPACATGGKKLTMELIPDNGRLNVEVRDNGRVIDRFDSVKHAIIVVGPDSNEKEKLIIFVDPNHLDPNAVSYHVNNEVFAKLSERFSYSVLSAEK